MDGKIDKSEDNHLSINESIFEDDLLLDFSDGLPGVESLGTCLGAIHDGVAAVQLERVIQRLQSLLGHLVSLRQR